MKMFKKLISIGVMCFALSSPALAISGTKPPPNGVVSWVQYLPFTDGSVWGEW